MKLFIIPMKISGILIVLTTLATLTCLKGISQCVYDINEDGIVNLDDYLQHIAHYGMNEGDIEEGEELPTDHNSNGICEIEDLIELLPNLGYSDCFDIIENNEDIGEIVIVVHHVHETELVDNGNVIPAGWITYRMYVNVFNPELLLNAIYGNTSSPLNIYSSSTFFQFHLPLGNSLWQGTPEYVSEGFLSIFPSLAYNSWLTLNWNPILPNSSSTSFVDSPDDDWRNHFLDQNEIAINDVVGSGLVRPIGQYTSNASYPNLYLLGQFTTDPLGLEGVVNLSFHLPLQNNQIEISLKTLYFSADNIEILGCMNLLSANYNSSATFDDGSCSAPGDFNGDGEVTIEDLMILISEFGCLLDCQDGDINNDGIVNVADVIAFLEFI